MTKKLIVLVAIPLAASSLSAADQLQKVEYKKTGFTISTKIDKKNVTFERDRGLLFDDSLLIEEGKSALKIMDSGLDGTVERVSINGYEFSHTTSSYKGEIKVGLTEDQYKALFKEAESCLKMYKGLLGVDEVEKKAPYNNLIETAKDLMQ